MTVRDAIVGVLVTVILLLLMGTMVWLCAPGLTAFGAPELRWADATAVVVVLHTACVVIRNGLGLHRGDR